MIPQIISKIATFREVNLSTDEIVEAIGASFVCPRNMILDILTFQNKLTDSEIINVVGLRVRNGNYAEQLPARNEAKQASAASKAVSTSSSSLPTASSGAVSSVSVPIVTAAKVKAKPSVVPDWIEIEDEQFMIDKNGNVFDPENDKKIGKYDKMQKKWLSGGIPSLEDATEVEECTVELPVATASASSSSSLPTTSS